MDNEFRKYKLNNGCIVETRGGSKYMFLKDVRNGVEVYEDLFINLETGEYLSLNFYDDTLKDNDFEANDNIVKICDMPYVGDNIRYHIINDTDEWTAEREENEKEDLKEMIEEIIEKVDKIAATLKN